MSLKVRIVIISNIFLLIIVVVLPQSSWSFDPNDIVFHFRGTDTTSKIGIVLTPLGDINNDGFDDIAMSSISPKGVYVFYGGNPVDSIPDLFLKGYSSAPPVDFTGDGIPDLLTSIVYDEGASNLGVVYLFDGFVDSIGSAPFDSVSPAAPNYGFGAIPVTGYVDGDNIGDLLISQRYHPEGPTLLYYSGFYGIDTVVDWSYDIVGNSHIFPVQSYGFIDFDGDGYVDIYLGLSPDLDTLGYVYIFKGPGFGAQPDYTLGYPIELDSLFPEFFASAVVNTGDLNGDSWDDLAVSFQGYILIYFCGPSADTLFDKTLEYKSRHLASAGDVNNDGLNDLVSGNINRSASGSVDIYLGTYGFDTAADDYILRTDLPPLNLEMVGYRVSTAGNVNGDEYDDYMFACQNFFGGDPGDVFIIQGNSNFPTGIEIEYEPTIPAVFQLSQNYPNPFNPTTTIEFSLPTRGHVSLKVVNMLGQEVVTLLDKQLSVGSYKVNWDGRDDAGSEVASGVYFYKLESGGFVESKKMMLVR